MKDSQKCSLTQQKTNRLSNQRGIPRSENPKHKTLISWLNPKYTCRDAICFAARGVSIQPRLQIITMTKKGLLEQGAFDATLSCSSYFTVAPFHAHVVEKTWAWLRPNILEYSRRFTIVCRLVWMSLSPWVPLSWHSAIQKILESSDEHKPDIGVSFYCMETLHLLLARSCRRSVICFHRFLLNKNLKPPVHSMGSCCFERSFFDAENHSSTTCKLFEANVGLLSWLSYCIEIAETAVTMPAS